ncbi:EAL domain-containing protein [Deinococcus alpinitundrae]|uniref:EAL domain-containing protein n=1 Tax=Deinococcus alpinitundrae TaxID=468913 RepID=UPI00137A09AF|nr:EAL domain-containing protein [Deinococcus alpinitundrae]
MPESSLQVSEVAEVDGDAQDLSTVSYHPGVSLPNSPQNVAIVGDYIHNYQAHLLAGIREVLDAHGVASTIYVGRELVPEGHSLHSANLVYDLIQPQQHSGVIIISANLGRSASEQEMAAFASRFHSLPTVAIGRKIEGIPSVVIDNRAGMDALMDHLIVNRELKRFVFMRGRTGNEDSNIREQVFRDKLDFYGLHLDESLVLNGDFRVGIAYDEMTKLLAATTDFDVVVAANDEMADGVIMALRKHGLRVPGDVAVVGFDDDEHYRNAIPPLTSVRQPFLEQARVATELLFNEGIRTDIYLPAQLIVRESCGIKSTASSDHSLIRQIEQLSGLHREVFEKYRFAASRPERHQAFLEDFKTTLLEHLHQDQHFAIWRVRLGEFRRVIRSTLDDALLEASEVLYSDAQTLLYDALQMAHVRQRLAETNNAVLLSNMTSAVSYDALFETARKYLKNLHLERAILVLYSSFGSTLNPESRVVFTEGITSSMDGTPFPTSQLLPNSMRSELAHGHLLVTPLFFQQEQYGYLLADQPVDIFFDEQTPQHTISQSIHQLEQMHALQAAHNRLEQRVADRTLELQRLNTQLWHAAIHDVLTGLANKALFHEQLQRVIARASRHPSQGFSVLFLDCDRFKTVNDTFGHHIGDRFLIEFAQRVESSVRAQDTVARFGGDEFAVLLDDIQEPQGALKIAQRIQQALSKPFEIGGHLSAVTASIGIVTNQGQYRQYEDIMRDADIAMYRAKASGPGQSVVFEQAMHDHLLARTWLEGELRQALSQRALSVYYQPIVRIETAELIGFEALARWKHPVRGFVSPAEFISVAEDIGLISEIDQFVLREACQQIHAWSKIAPQAKQCFLSVNASTLQFSRPDFADVVQGILHETAFAPAFLRLEITESLLLRRSATVQNNINALRHLGLQLYIDDFGTGYSSLSYLQQFAASALKIDRSFIRQLFSSAENAELVRTILAMAQSLRMKVVAEGIESVEQWKWLQQAGCDYAQGYYFGAPMPAEEAFSLLLHDQPLPY